MMDDFFPDRCLLPEEVPAALERHRKARSGEKEFKVTLVVFDLGRLTYRCRTENDRFYADLEVAE